MASLKQSFYCVMLVRMETRGGEKERQGPTSDCIRLYGGAAELPRRLTLRRSLSAHSPQCTSDVP